MDLPSLKEFMKRLRESLPDSPVMPKTSLSYYPAGEPILLLEFMDLDSGTFKSRIEIYEIHPNEKLIYRYEGRSRRDPAREWPLGHHRQYGILNILPPRLGFSNPRKIGLIQVGKLNG